MKKIVIMCSIVLSGFAFAQDSSDNPFVYENSVMEEDVLPGNPGDPVNPAPIDEYIPVLLGVAGMIAFAYVRKKNTVEN